jgi:hypothetical protein
MLNAPRAALVSAVALIATLLAPMSPASARVCSYSGAVISVRQGAAVGGGVQEDNYDYYNSFDADQCWDFQGTYLKLAPDYSTYVEVYLRYRPQNLGGDYIQGRYQIYPGGPRYVGEVQSTGTGYVSLAISLSSGTSYRMLVDGDGGQNTYQDLVYCCSLTGSTGYASGRPQSYTTGGGYNVKSAHLLKAKSATNGTWAPWASLDCDFTRTNDPDWYAIKSSNTSWYTARGQGGFCS